ncbi:MAG TPA: alpha-L-rhamnosidase C-terminal domain-containing protein, partial [Candidatus Hydrogenedentes bacterium]|nr:alpha-L-rhamnosidase C-terminal domain-containing protein [Candidatus Hydrogenedentota bacterium]
AFSWSITIPANTEATVHVPTLNPDAVSESGEPAANAEGVTFLRMENGTAVYAVVAGQYQFNATTFVRPGSESAGAL